MDRIGPRRIIALAMALQAAGIAWLGLESTTDLPYMRLVPPFILAGLGMGLFFAPMARLVLSFAPAELEGVASGTSNALRQLGTVLGIAVLGSIFSAYGGYASNQSFVDGMGVAMEVGAVVLAAGAGLILLAPRRTPVSPGTGVPAVTERGETVTGDLALESLNV
jgi:MFS family permease